MPRFFDAGSTKEGRPFFVMELGAGDARLQPIATNAALMSCNGLSCLFRYATPYSMHTRRGLFIATLNPSNVIIAQVGGVAVPKVIDFGNCKGGQRTESVRQYPVYRPWSSFVGTPDLYESGGRRDMAEMDIDVRSDILQSRRPAL